MGIEQQPAAHFPNSLLQLATGLRIRDHIEDGRDEVDAFSDAPRSGIAPEQRSCAGILVQ